MASLETGFSNSSGMRQLVNQDQPEGPISALDAWALSISGKGNIDPSRPQHAPEVARMANAIAQGQISEAGVNNLIRYNPRTAPVFLDALGQYKSAKSTQQALGQFFSPGSTGTPDRPYSAQDVGSGIGPYQLGYPIPGTGTPATPPKRDYEGAINFLIAHNQIDSAKKLSETVKELTARQQSTQMERAITGMIAYRKQAMIAAGVPQDKIDAWEQNARDQANAAMFTAPKTTIDPNTGTMVSTHLELPPAFNSYIPQANSGNAIPAPRPNVNANINFGPKAWDAEKDKISTKLQNSGILDAIDPLTRLNEQMSKPVDIPGIGGAKNIKGAEYFLTEEGKQNRSDFTSILNQIVKKNSGATVTDQEFARNLLALANTPAFGAQDMRNAWPKILSIYQNMVASTAAGSNPQAVKLFEQDYKIRAGRDLFNNPLLNPGLKKTTAFTPKQLRIKALMEGR